MLREMLAAALVALPGREETRRKDLEAENHRLHDLVDALHRRCDWLEHCVIEANRRLQEKDGDDD